MTMSSRIERTETTTLMSFLIACEETDFLWEARVQERWLGQYESLDEDDLDDDRMAIWGRIDGDWFAAIVVIDGNGHVDELIRREQFGNMDTAVSLYHRLR